MAPIANRLDSYLRRNRETHRAFADRAGIPHLHPMVSQWAKDKRWPGLVTALAIQKATGGKVPASYWPQRREYLERLSSR